MGAYRRPTDTWFVACAQHCPCKQGTWFAPRQLELTRKVNTPQCSPALQLTMPPLSFSKRFVAVVAVGLDSLQLDSRCFADEFKSPMDPCSRSSSVFGHKLTNRSKQTKNLNRCSALKRRPFLPCWLPLLWLPSLPTCLSCLVWPRTLPST